MSDKIVNCEICGIEYPIKVGAYNRKVKEGTRFCCSLSCNGKLGNNKRWTKDIVSPTSVTTLTQTDVPDKIARLRQILIMEDSEGRYMPFDWVFQQIRELYPTTPLYLPSERITKWREDIINHGLFTEPA